MFADTAIVLDFETTGLHCDQGDRVTEVAAVRIHGGQVVDTFTSLVNCDMRIPRHIATFTGITQSMVDSAPQSSAVFSQLLTFIGDDPVIAHNAWFDQGFFTSETARLGLQRSLPDFVCSFRIARRILPHMKSHALGCLASHLRIPFTPGAHRAAVDATVGANVILRLCDLVRTQLAVRTVDMSVLRRLAHLQAQDVAVASAA